MRSEILFREGLALGLDRDDEIVRRRVVQKIEFLNEDTRRRKLRMTPSSSRFFALPSDRVCRRRRRVSFEQVYFSADRGGEAVARRSRRSRADVAAEAVRGTPIRVRSGDSI